MYETAYKIAVTSFVGYIMYSVFTPKQKTVLDTNKNIMYWKNKPSG